MMDDEKLKLEIEDIEEQVTTNSKLLNQWKDEQRVELERLLAIQRNIVRAEMKVDTLTIKKKEMEERQIKTEKYISGEKMSTEKPYE
jgi:hypothetical protein